MQTVSARSSSVRVAARKAPAGRISVHVVCKASPVSNVVKQMSAAVIALPTMIVTSPAFALVDQRMNGDGTGRSLGINDDQLIYAMTGIFGLVWFLWYSSQKDLGNDADTGSL